jgi:hypothetical protein
VKAWDIYTAKSIEGLVVAGPYVVLSVAGRRDCVVGSRHSMKPPLAPVALLYVGGILIGCVIPVSL